MSVQEKNASTNLLDGKVGRVYVPRQDMDAIALHKMKVQPLSSAWHAGADRIPASFHEHQHQLCMQPWSCFKIGHLATSSMDWLSRHLHWIMTALAAAQHDVHG